MTFSYSNTGAMLLSGIIAQASGMEAGPYARQKFFTLLGIADVRWVTDAFGHTQTQGGLVIAPRSLLRLGRMLAGHGVFRGQRLIDGARLDASTTGSPLSPCYGELYWLLGGEYTDPSVGVPSVNGYFAFGWGGNYLVVLPSKTLTAVRLRYASRALDYVSDTAFGDFPDRVTSVVR